MLAEDKCGLAIKCLQESKSRKYIVQITAINFFLPYFFQIIDLMKIISDYEKAGTLGKEYASLKGTGTIAKPTEHLFFRKLGPIVNRTLDKCVRENGFM